MNQHWHRSIGLISTALLLSAGAPGAGRPDGPQPRIGVVVRTPPLLTVRGTGGTQSALLTDADRLRMRVRTALFTETDRSLTVVRTTLFTEKDWQRMAIRNAVFNPAAPGPTAARPATRRYGQ